MDRSACALVDGLPVYPAGTLGEVVDFLTGKRALEPCRVDLSTMFGQAVQDDVDLTRIGEIVAEEWLETENVRLNVELDEWVIMPNHVHLILVITFQIPSIKTPSQETPQRGVSTGAASEKWAANTVGSIIGQFKGKCTKRIWAEGFTEFAWQPRFYDRIIRDEEALNKARVYIASNPTNWDEDQDNLPGLYM